MSIAYSNAPIVYRSFAIPDSAALLNGIHSAVSAAGWLAEPLADGWKYTLTSPQSLVCKATLRAAPTLEEGYGPGRFHFLAIQFMSEDESLVGPVHPVAWEAGQVLQVIAGRCQFFCSRPGVSYTSHAGYAVMGGIPRVPDPYCVVGQTVSGVVGSGTCNTEGTQAHWKSGATVFQTSWVGLSIVIRGLAYTIVSVSEWGTGASMELSGDAGNQSDAPFDVGTLTLPYSVGTTAEAWWSLGDADGSANGNKFTFRQTWSPCGGSAGGIYGVCRNGVLLVNNAYDYLNGVRLVPRSRDQGTYQVALVQLYDGSPLWFDPLLAWGEVAGATDFARFRGQLWDARWRSQESILDKVESIDGYDWMNYTQRTGSDPRSSYLGSLYLLRSSAVKPPQRTGQIMSGY